MLNSSMYRWELWVIHQQWTPTPCSCPSTRGSSTTPAPWPRSIFLIWFKTSTLLWYFSFHLSKVHFIKNDITFLSYSISFGENSKIIKYQMAFLYHISAINVDKNVYIELLSLSNLHTLAFLISSDVYV